MCFNRVKGIVKRIWYEGASVSNKVINKITGRTEYGDLAPVDRIPEGKEYLKALDWAIKNPRVKNIALSGPYGSGKSSIIETYLRCHPILRKKTIRISMATFEQSTNEKIEFKEKEIQEGILKQLFYKVKQSRIPQSRFRKLHKIRYLSIFACICGACLLGVAYSFVFLPEEFVTTIEKIYNAGNKLGLGERISLAIVLIISGFVLALMSEILRRVVSKFRISEVKLPKEIAAAQSGEEENSVFDRHMDEIVYFFEETKYQYVFFEDLDRLSDPKVFVQLRELNTLLNSSDFIKKPVVFVYAVKDDIFSEDDRTKFFEFIIPVVPIINSTNSGEILLDMLRDKKDRFKHGISRTFIDDVSPYISDMRVLQNIYNEFLIYKQTLQKEQGLHLFDEEMMALMVFKNLYPKEFADIQKEKGVIKEAFESKTAFLDSYVRRIDVEINERQASLESIENDILKSAKQLKVAFLYEITNDNGLASEITGNNGGQTYSRNTILSDDFDFRRIQGLRGWITYPTGYYSNTKSIAISEKQIAMIDDYVTRWEYLQIVEQGKQDEYRRIIEELKTEKRDLRIRTLKVLIEKYGAEKVLPEEVRKNKLLVFLLRKGYINERYADYINYFKGKSITRDDMNFILSIKNCEALPFEYKLNKIEQIIERLQEHEFGQKEIRNFDLLEYLLSDKLGFTKKLNVFIKMLADQESDNWTFIDEFIERTKEKAEFISLMTTECKRIWKHIYDDCVLTYERKVFYFRLLIESVDVARINELNLDGTVKRFFEENPDILEKLEDLQWNKTADVIERINVRFEELRIQGVDNRLLDFVFDNQYYALNLSMISLIIGVKAAEYLDGVERRNYSSICKSGYNRLIEYVHSQINEYVDNVVMLADNTDEEEEYFIDLLKRCVDSPKRCEKLIQHEVCCITDLKACCGDLIEEKCEGVKHIWNTLLNEQKTMPTWKNIEQYWSVYGVTDELISFVEESIDLLVTEDNQNASEEFLGALVNSNIEVKAFEKLIQSITQRAYEIDIENLMQEKVEILISYDCIEFAEENYRIIMEHHVALLGYFIAKNQSAYASLINGLEMVSELLEEIIERADVGIDIKKSVLERYGKEHMTHGIARNLCKQKIRIPIGVFDAAWNALKNDEKAELLYNNLEILDANAFEKCFVSMNKIGFAVCGLEDRSSGHQVRIEYSEPNMALVKRLQEVGYITSHECKTRKSYSDGHKELEIMCRVKKKSI